jgi:hypothetical protein
MHSFPIPASISLKIYDVFQFITSDYIPFLKESVRGFTGSYIFGDRASGKLWSYLVNSKTEWLASYKLLQAEYGPNMNDNSKKTKVFQTDFDSVVHETEFTTYLLKAGTRLFNSAPHRHAQNLIERFIQTIKNMVRTNMSYNRAPANYWCYALQYAVDTYNMLSAKGNTATRNEIFSSEKTDISKCAPFYARGWSYINETERKYLNSNPKFQRKDKALDVRMLGYTDPYRIEDRTKALCYVKNSYVVESDLYTEEILRHDCHFQVTPDGDPNLFHPNPNNRTPTLDPLEDERLEKKLQEEYDEYLDSVQDTDLNYPSELSTDGVSILHPGATYDQTTDYWYSEEESLVPLANLATIYSSSDNPYSFSVFGVSPPAPPKTKNPEIATKTLKHGETLPRPSPGLEINFSNALDIKAANSIDLQSSSSILGTKSGKIGKPDISDQIARKSKKSKTKRKRPNKKLLEDKVSNDPLCIGGNDGQPGVPSAEESSDPETGLLSYVLTLTSYKNGNESLSISMGNSLSHLTRPSPELSKPGEPLVQPTSITDALSGKHPLPWIFAALDEIHNLDLRNTWKFVPQSKDVNLNAIKSKFAFRLTIRPDDFLKFRARLVACGYSQIPGKDFDLTFAPTAKYKSLCIVLHLAAIFGWEIAGIDVSNAYIEAKIDKLIYMILPKDLFRWPDGSRVVVELLQSIYGLKQAGELWNSLLNEKITEFGFTRCMHDKCVYVLREQETGVVTIIVVYVDDVLFTGNSPTVIESVITYLIAQFTKLTNMGRLLGLYRFIVDE